MSRFNQAANRVSETTNKAGGAAIAINDTNFKLYSMVATNFVSDRFYQSANSNLESLRLAIAAADPMFVAKLAVYARQNLNLRTAPLILMIELARIHNGDNLVSKGLFHTIQRADELAEALAYYKVANGHSNLKKLSKQVSKGISEAFHKFDEYQFAKYRGNGKDISLRDAMFVTHPKPTSIDQAELFNRIAEDTLATPETWEAKKSVMGQKMANASESQKREASKNTWESMIDSKKMGYMATLRNLRNFLQDDISQAHIEKVCKYLTNPKAIENSKQLPFRFYTAYRELNGQLGGIEPIFKRSKYSTGSDLVFEIIESADPIKARMLLAALKEAGIASLSNLEMFDTSERVISVVDVSGSMSGTPISGESTVKPIEVAAFYGAMLHKLNPSCRLGYFGTSFSFERNFDVDPFQLPTTNHELSSRHGHGTNAHEVFRHLESNNVIADKVVLFSDMQFWDSGQHALSRFNSNSFMNSWKKYKKKAPNAKLILIDLVGYSGSTPTVVDGDVTYVSGFSSETFRILGNMSRSREILDEINAIEL